MKTEYKTNLKKRMQEENKNWEIVVKNKEVADSVSFELTTPFSSDKDTIKNVLHKVELDIMSNLHFGFEKPIQIFVREVKGE